MILLVPAAVAALVDWWAVATGRRSVERWAKPLTMALLVGVAALVGDASGDVRTLIVVGAVFGLAGDIALLGEGEGAFMAGLGAFLVGHLGYAVAAWRIDHRPAWAVLGLVLVAGLLAFRFATRTVPGARRHGGAVLATAVVVYAVVIAAMVTAAWGTGSVLAGVGAFLFAASDWVLGYQRFVGPLRVGRLGVIVPYHAGQAMLIVGLLTA